MSVSVISDLQNDNIVKARSDMKIEFFANNVGETIFSVSFGIKLWNGLKSAVPSNPQFQVQIPSTAIELGRQSYLVEVSDFIKTALGKQDLNANSSRATWVQVEYIILTDDGSTNPSYGGTLNCSAVRGWSDTDAGKVASEYHLPGGIYYVPENTDYKFQILDFANANGSRNLQEISFTYEDGTGGSITLPDTPTIDSTEIHQLITIPMTGHTSATVLLQSATVTLKTFNVEVRCRDKYGIRKLDYKDRNGATSSLYLFGRSNRSQTVERDTFRRSTLPASNTVKYAIDDVNGRESEELNTDFVSESYDGVIQDILLTEQAELDGRRVNVTDTSKTYKESVNELINYSLNVKFADDTILNI